MDHKKSRVDQKQKNIPAPKLFKKKARQIFFSKQKKSVSKVFRQKNMY